jgi:hypothetical protein
MRAREWCLLCVAVALSPLAAAQNADAVRGGWMADVGGVRHIYMLTVRDGVVTGTYCTECSNPDTLALIDNGVLEADGARFDVHNPGPTAYTDTVTARLVNGELTIKRQRKGSSAAPTTMTLHRSTTEGPAPPPAPAGPAPARAAYVPPGAAEALSPAKVAGLWLWGAPGPDKQHFMFKQAGSQLFGLACGPCDDPNHMAPLDRISIDGTTLRFSIVHENNARAFYDKGPFSNNVRAQIAKHEMHMWVVASYQPADSTPGEITMFGPITKY